MKASHRVLIVAGLLVTIAGVMAYKTVVSGESGTAVAACCSASAPLVSASMAPAAPTCTVDLPRLLDLGAGKCIPCKMMVPILESLKTGYEGKLSVEFIDVWENPDAGQKYGVQMIPTQIFYDAQGKELFRHTGFFSKEDILKKWKELGIELGESKVP